MIIHQILQPVPNEDNIIVGFNEYRIIDHHHVLATNLTHDDIHNMVQDLLPLLTLGPGARIEDVRDEFLTGFRISAESYGMVMARLTIGGYINGAQNRIRNILAITASTINVPFGQFNLWKIEINILCDIYPP